MKQMALSRGFYPVVALAPEGPGNQSKMPSKGKGKGKSKGKPSTAAPPPRSSKGKRKGKSGKKGFRRWIPSSGASNTSSTTRASTTGSVPSGSTTSGSSQQHGPRFKRMRSGQSRAEALMLTEVENEVFLIHSSVCRLLSSRRRSLSRPAAVLSIPGPLSL